MHRQKAKCLLHLNHGCYTIIENVLQYLCGICRASLWSAITRGTKEYMWPTNWWIIFMYFLKYWLKNVLFRHLSIQCKIRCNRLSDTRQSTVWCHQRFGHPWSVSVFKLHFLLVRILNILPQVLCSQPLLKDWVCSFCKLHSFTIFYTMVYSQCYKTYFLCFINWLNAGALLQLADAGGIGHMTRTISLD